MDGDLREGDDSLCATIIPLCDPLKSKEALVAVFRCLQVKSLSWIVLFVLSKSDFRHSQDCAHFKSKGARRHSSRRFLRAKAFMTCSNFIFPQTLEIFKYFPDSLMSLSLVNPFA